MKHLKISYPSSERNIDLRQFTGNPDNQVGGWILHVNDGIQVADAWVVIEDVSKNDRTCAVPAGSLFFATAEVIQPDGYYSESQSRRSHLTQFDHVLTCHGILADNVESHPPFLPWMVNSNHGPTMNAPHVRDLLFFERLQTVHKSKAISVICSTKTQTPEHVQRLRFVERLSAQFAGGLDWFGNGVRSIPEKWDGLAPYRYTIAIENKMAHNVVTEKVQDAFLALTLPVYWGAPNIGEYFDTRGLVSIDIRDWRSAVTTIERILDEDPYERSLPFLLENKRRVLNEMHYLRRLVRAVERLSEDGSTREQRSVRTELQIAGRSARYRRAAGRRLERIGQSLNR